MGLEKIFSSNKYKISLMASEFGKKAIQYREFKFHKNFVASF